MKETYACFYPESPREGGIKAITKRIDFVVRVIEGNEGKGAEEAAGWFYLGTRRKLPDDVKLAIMRHFSEAIANMMLWEEGGHPKDCPVQIMNF